MPLQGFKIISHNVGCLIDECLDAMTGIRELVNILWRANGSFKDCTAVIGETENESFPLEQVIEQSFFFKFAGFHFFPSCG